MTPKIDSLESPRLHLEIRKKHHAAELYEYLCEKDLYQFLNRDVPPSADWLADGFKQLETLLSRDGQEILLGWIGRDKVTGKPVGIFEVFINKQDVHLAYTVFKDNWGQGFACEATQAVIDYISTNYKVQKFVIEMDTRNRASTKVAEKLGFRFVKLTSNATFLKNFVSHEFKFEKTIC